VRAASAILALLLVAWLALVAVGAGGGVSGYCVVRVYPDGSTLFEYRLVVADVPSNVSMRAPRGAVYVSVVAGGEPAPYTYDGERGTLYFPALYRDVTVRVYTLEYTSKEGALWELKLEPLDFETLIALPEGALLVSVEPREFTVKLVNGTPLLAFKPGSAVRLVYTIVPTATGTPAPGAPTTATPPVATTTPPAGETTQAREAPVVSPLLLAILALGALAALAIAVLAISRRRAGPPFR